MIPFEEMSREELLRAVQDNQNVMASWVDAVERVRELHAKLSLNDGSAPICEWDDELYPCTTIMVLDGI